MHLPRRNVERQALQDGFVVEGDVEVVDGEHELVVLQKFRIARGETPKFGFVSVPIGSDSSRANEQFAKLIIVETAEPLLDRFKGSAFPIRLLE